MTIDHTTARRIASDAHEGVLEAEQERDLALHLVTCPDCKSFYDGLAMTREAAAAAVPSAPPAEALESAVHRATTILSGEADPGSPWAPAKRHQPETPTADPFFDTQEEAESETTGPLASSSLAAETEPAPPPVEPAEPQPAADDTGPLPGEWRPAEPGGERPVPPRPEALAPPPVFAPEEVEEREDLGPYPSEVFPGPAPPAPRSRVGPWLLAILATLIVAGIAGYLFVNRPTLLDESREGLPEPAELQRRVSAAFDDLTSLKTTYSITRLGLYRVRQDDDRIVYAFSNAEITGRVLFEEPDRLREERTVQVADAPARRSTVVLTPEELRTLHRGEGEDVLRVMAGYPMGPAAGELQPRLGVIEEAMGVPARMLATADRVEVLERTTVQERDAYRVRFSVRPNEITRADTIEALVDAGSWLPVRVRRSISRNAAEVLAPGGVLGPDAVDAAFGNRNRITTELVELSDVVVDDVVLPGEFVLDAPGEVDEQTDARGFSRVPVAGLPEELPFEARVPLTPPNGLREMMYLVADGGEGWGPEDDYPEPEGILQIVYTDGELTFVAEQRALEDGAFEIEGSPLVPEGVPLTTRTEVRSGIRWTYAVSPETPPHVFGFADDLFIIVSGYGSENDLVRIASAVASAEVLTEQATDTVDGEEDTADASPVP